MNESRATEAARFYNHVYQERGYADFRAPSAHFAFQDLSGFIDAFDLRQRKCLEVGCGRGLFQDLVEDYTGIDLSRSAGRYLRKPFCCCSATSLPFEDCSFDAVWTVTVLEHVPEPEAALCEMRRVLRPGGLLFLKAAWHCRPWICEGIPVRPYATCHFGSAISRPHCPSESGCLSGQPGTPSSAFLSSWARCSGPLQPRYGFGGCRPTTRRSGWLIRTPLFRSILLTFFCGFAPREIRCSPILRLGRPSQAGGNHWWFGSGPASDSRGDVDQRHKSGRSAYRGLFVGRRSRKNALRSSTRRSGCLERREVSAVRHLGPARDVVIRLGPGSGHHRDVVRKDGGGRRHLDSAQRAG